MRVGIDFAFFVGILFAKSISVLTAETIIKATITLFITEKHLSRLVFSGDKMRLAINITLYLLFQLAATLLFKWGSTGAGRFWLGFSVGNLIGLISILFLMYIYRELQPNLAAAICTGGSFLTIQLTMAFFFTTGLSLAQWSGVFLITAGIALLALA